MPDKLWLLRYMLTNVHFRQSFFIAFPCAMITAILETAQNYYFPTLFAEQGVFVGNESYSMLTFLVGFTVIFRTQNAYGRYWEGVETIYHISGDFYDAASSLTAMCSRNEDQKKKVNIFKHKIVRLFSLLNALIYDELEDVSESRQKGSGFAVCELPLIDPTGIDAPTLSVLDGVENKVETTFQWIQLLVVENMRNGTLDVPAPILTRVFQEMGAGMLKFHGALKLAHIPFPLPYSATTHILIMMHWVISPLAICNAVSSSAWALVLSFLPVFTIWALNGIAGELENPFCKGCSGVDLGPKHLRQNHRLLSLLSKDLSRLPELSPHATLDEDRLLDFSTLRLSRINSGTRASLTLQNTLSHVRSFATASMTVETTMSVSSDDMHDQMPSEAQAHSTVIPLDNDAAHYHGNYDKAPPPQGVSEDGMSFYHSIQSTINPSHRYSDMKQPSSRKSVRFATSSESEPSPPHRGDDRQDPTLREACGGATQPHFAGSTGGAAKASKHSL